MPEHVDVRKGAYHDSVSLMQVSRTVGDLDGVDAALIAMATELNLDFLEPMGFDLGGHDAGPNDLLIAIRAVDDDTLATAVEAADAALAAAQRGGEGGFGEQAPARSVAAALRRAEADLVLVSTPGEHAFIEALDALRAGANVMIFSDNVSIDDERKLKDEASGRGLLVMGPDCGTAIVGGVGLGFANAVRSGPVGIVAASGTGAQQLSCLLDDAGVGVTHVIGVGGRDLKDEIGGVSTLAAMAALDDDPDTELIVVLSKPPAPDVAGRVREAAERSTTPVVLGLIGPEADDLTQVSRNALEALGTDAPAPRTWQPADAQQNSDAGERAPRPGLVTGLFAGGTLCTEAMILASRELGPIRSNVPVEPGWTLDGDAGAGHVMLDLGEDEYTRGRPHPMIDQSLRVARIAEAAERDDLAVLLLDVVLGHGAHDDPAADLAPAIRDAREHAAAAGRDLAVVVSLCGASGDPQGRDRQAEALAAAGASVHLSNADAAREATRLIATS